MARAKSAETAESATPAAPAPAHDAEALSAMTLEFNAMTPRPGRIAQLDALRSRAQALIWDPDHLRMFLVDLIETLK
ncbi:MAG TPA: hypothetical protein VI384_04290 [Candidatus Dormibacteraeota bacterium]